MNHHKVMTTCAKLVLGVGLAASLVAQGQPAAKQPAPAVAVSQFSYNYFDLLYTQADFDDVDRDVDGIGFAGAYELDEQLFLLGSYTMTDGDEGVWGFSKLDADITSLSIGAGFRQAINNRSDLVVTGSLVRTEVDADGFAIVPFLGLIPYDAGATDTSLALSGGVRHQLNDQLEINGAVHWSDADESDLHFTAGGLLKLNEQFSVGGELGFGDVDSLTLRARYHY